MDGFSFSEKENHGHPFQITSPKRFWFGTSPAQKPHWQVTASTGLRLHQLKRLPSFHLVITNHPLLGMVNVSNLFSDAAVAIWERGGEHP